MMTSSSKTRIGRMMLAAALSLATSTGSVHADSVSVSPTNLTVGAPQKTTMLTVKAGGKNTSVLQVRVMRWNERDDPAKLKATRDVVVSPPVAKLKTNQELTVRIVRVSNRKVRGRECYRVLVDRLPENDADGQAVKLRVRHSVPLCFTS